MKTHSLQIAMVVSRPEFESDKLFEITTLQDTSGGLTRWKILQRFLLDKDIEFHTHDQFESLREPDLLIVEDPTRAIALQIIRAMVNPRRMIIILNEPAVIRPWTWKYLKFYSRFIGRILTTDKRVIKQPNISWLPLPQPFDGHDLIDSQYFRGTSKDKFMVMLRGNKVSTIEGELYSERRRLVRYFEDRGDDLLDLYGPGWNDPCHRTPTFFRNYRGYADSTVSTYSHYKFVLGMDNSAVPGLFTYDLFSAYFVGSVPVYLGAPDIRDHVPKDSYVEYSDFSSLDALVDRLYTIANSPEWGAYRDRGTEFINSAKFKLFTMEHFCETVYDAIVALAPKSKTSDLKL